MKNTDKKNYKKSLHVTVNYAIMESNKEAAVSGERRIENDEVQVQRTCEEQA